jgi:lipopolysaccharide export system protein LptA
MIQISLQNRFSPVRIFLLLFLVVGSGLVQQLQAQNAVNIREAENIDRGTYQGEPVQKIIGNVRMQNENLEVFCDSAYRFLGKSEIRAFGNVQVNTESEKIWADTLTYFTDVDFSQLRGRVIIEADSTTLYGNSVDYRFSTKVAHFLDRIRLEDQRGVLLANSGFYYREADSAEFRGNVQLRDSLQYIEGDSLFSNRGSDYYELYGDIYGNDRENDTMIQGNYLESDSTGRRLLTGRQNNAWLKSFETDTTDSTRADTTHIRAQEILSIEERTAVDTTALVFGYDSVRIWSPNFSSVSDTSKYNNTTETFELWSNAKAWYEQVQLSGPYIEAQLRSGDIDSLKSYPRPFSVQQDTVIDRLNQITGDTLHADFEDGNLNQIYVFGNSNLLRFTKNDQQQPDGAIDLTAPNIRIFFEAGQLVEMKAIGAINGSYLPETEQTANRRLDGFTWNPKLRPTRPQQKMQRRLPPVTNDVFFELPQRYLQHLRDMHPSSKKLQKFSSTPDKKSGK